jgi:hypothetical protein
MVILNGISNDKEELHKIELRRVARYRVVKGKSWHIVAGSLQNPIKLNFNTPCVSCHNTVY